MAFAQERSNFVIMWTLWVSKDPEFYVDFKNINIT
jgi:hypothetical protein